MNKKSGVGSEEIGRGVHNSIGGLALALYMASRGRDTGDKLLNGAGGFLLGNLATDSALGFIGNARAKGDLEKIQPGQEDKARRSAGKDDLKNILIPSQAQKNRYLRRQLG